MTGFYFLVSTNISHFPNSFYKHIDRPLSLLNNLIRLKFVIFHGLGCFTFAVDLIPKKVL